jgi:hypothetical protein
MILETLVHSTDSAPPPGNLPASRRTRKRNDRDGNIAAPPAYTVAWWRVVPGREADFLLAWRRFGDVLARLERPPIGGSLMRNSHDPGLFCSSGAWQSPDDVEAMKRDSEAQDAFLELVACCHQAEPGMYEVIEALPIPRRFDKQC